MVKAKLSNWDVCLKGLSKKYDESLFQLNSEKAQLIKTEALQIDLAELEGALGIFGLPMGRIVEIYGPESGGKSSAATHIAAKAQAQYPDRPVVYIDVEHAFDPTFARKLGLSDENFFLGQPTSGEQALQTAITVAESGEPSVIVIDSIAALVSKAELEGEMDKQQMGVTARMMGKFLRKITPTLKKNNILLVCINQIRMKLSGYGGETRPGGNALKYAASMVLRVRKAGDIKDGDEQVGIKIEIEVRKNKLAPPFKTAEIQLYFETGFSSEENLIKMAVDAGIIKQGGAWYTYQDKKWQGAQNVAIAIEEEGLYKEMYNTLKDTLLGNAVFIDPEEEEEEIPDELITEER